MQAVNSSVATTVATPPPLPGRAAEASPERPKVVAEKPSPAPDNIDVGQAARQVEKFVQSMARDLQFSVDEVSGNSVVRVVDRETKEVIRQIPSEEMLAIAHAIDRLQGLLLRQKA